MRCISSAAIVTQLQPNYPCALHNITRTKKIFTWLRLVLSVGMFVPVVGAAAVPTADSHGWIEVAPKDTHCWDGAPWHFWYHPGDPNKPRSGLGWRRVLERQHATLRNNPRLIQNSAPTTIRAPRLTSIAQHNPLMTSGWYCRIAPARMHVDNGPSNTPVATAANIAAHVGQRTSGLHSTH
jgi:hypothetical protein